MIMCPSLGLCFHAASEADLTPTMGVLLHEGASSSHATLKKSSEMPSKWQKPNKVKRSSAFAALTLVFSELLVCELASFLIELTEISQVV